MKKILVAYATMAGSTAQVADVVAEELSASGLQVEVRPLAEVKTVEPYDGVVVGAPMIMGWHRAALGFLSRHRVALQRRPFAVFVLCVSLTQTGETNVDGVQVRVDPNLPKPPTQPGRLTWKERYTSLANYIGPILRATRPARPCDLAVFGGRLEYGRLKWWAVMFVMLVIQATAGDRRDWAAIRAWASSLAAKFQGEPTPAPERREAVLA